MDVSATVLRGYITTLEGDCAPRYARQILTSLSHTPRCRIAVVVALGAAYAKARCSASRRRTDFERGVIRVRRQVQLLNGRLYFALPKGGRTRVVELPRSVAAELAAYFLQSPAVGVELPWGGPETRVTAEGTANPAVNGMPLQADPVGHSPLRFAQSANAADRRGRSKRGPVAPRGTGPRMGSSGRWADIARYAGAEGAVLGGLKPPRAAGITHSRVRQAPAQRRAAWIRSCSQQERRSSGWSRSRPNSSRARRSRYLRVFWWIVSRRAASPAFPAASSQAATEAA